MQKTESVSDGKEDGKKEEARNTPSQEGVNERASIKSST